MGSVRQQRAKYAKPAKHAKPGMIYLRYVECCKIKM